MRCSRFLPFLALVAALLVPAAQAQSPSDDLGYVDPGIVEGWFDGPPQVEVNLRGSLLRMAARTVEESTDEMEGVPNTGQLLERVTGIYVRVYENENPDLDMLEARTTELTERLGRQGWETVVRVREDDEQVSIQLRPRSEETVAGLVVLVNSTDGESVFVNIVGDISPEEIGQLTGSIGGLGGLGDLGSGDDEPEEDDS